MSASKHPAASCPLVGVSGTFGSEAVFDRRRCILHGSSWPETVGPRLEDRFPFWFQGQFHQALQHPIFHGGNAQRAKFAVGFRDEHPSNRQRHVVLQAETVLEQTFPVGIGDTYDSVDTGSSPAAVLLTDLADRQKLSRPERKPADVAGIPSPSTSPLTLAMKIRCCRRRTVFSTFCQSIWLQSSAA